MAKRNKKIGFGFMDMAIGGGVAYAVYVLFFKMNRMQALQILKSAGHASTLLEDPALFSDGYLIAWAKAKKSGSDSFVFEGDEFTTSTGKVKE